MQLPARFGKYELVQRLAKGGMAEIFLARSFGVEGFERHLVIKRILPELATSPKFVALFIKEAKISATLAHPNIVQIYELGRVSSDHYIAMEFLHGRDLTQVNKTLRADGERLPISLAVFIVASILRGLHHAHTRTDSNGRTLDLIHRDVSPHNVMVGFQGEVKLFDFGIARLVGEADSSSGMPGGGKYAYMSPEQASGGHMDRRSDIYSAGVVLYELLVGHRLYQDPDPAEKLRRVREADVPDPRKENPDIPDELWSIVQRMLARDVTERHENAGVAEEDLWAFLFRHGLRADAHQLAEFMAATFPEDAKGEPGIADLQGLASDLRRLEGGATGVTDVSNIEHNTPTHSSEKIMIPRLFKGNTGERKSVVVLMAEVTGFTDLSAAQDAADVVRWHYKLLRRLRRVVDRHGGLLENYQDDRFMVLFGVPRAGEHDLERAVACSEAIQMLTRQGSLRRQRVAISIGIHRGEITLGGKSGRTVRYLARGDTMKLAHQLCSKADLGEVLVSDRVAAMAGNRFRFSAGPTLRRKGSREEYKTFVLHGARDQIDPLTGRWVTRGDELDQLSRVIEGLANKQGAVVSVSGGAGVGKTRFLREVQRLTKARDVPFILSRARPYRGYRPFDVLRDVAAHAMGVSRQVSAEGVRTHMHRLKTLGMSDEDIEVIGAMYGARSRRDGRVDVDKMIGAAVRLVDGISSQGPIIIAIDDTQYIGSLERQIIGAAIRGRKNNPLIFLFSGRDQMPAEFRPADVQLTLGRMNPARLDKLAIEFLGVHSADPALLKVLQSTAEGNPLYVAEVIRALRASGRIVVEKGAARLLGDDTEVQLPVNLEGMIASRIDALGPAAKGVLQIAATVGLSFPVALVREASGLEDIGVLLRDLKSRGIIETGEDEHHGGARFSSVLLWEAVHRSILGVRLSEYHRMVADGMERLFGDKLEDRRMELASHCAAGGQFLRAAGHAERAGDRMRSQQMIHPALACWEEGIGWLDRLARPGRAARMKEAALRLKAGDGWRMAGDPRKAEIHLQVGQDLGSETGDTELEARATFALGQLYQYMGRTILSQASFESARSLSLSMVNRDDLSNLTPWRREVAVGALDGLGTLALEQGYGERGRKILEEARTLAGNDDLLAARVLTALSQDYIRQGDGDTALPLLEEARMRSESAQDPVLYGRVLNNLGILHAEAARYDTALDLFRSALKIREGLDYRMGAVINLHNIGDVHMRLGDDARAWAAFKKSHELAVASGFEHGEVMNEAYLAYLEGRQGQEGSEQRLLAVLGRADRIGQHETRVNARWFLGKYRMGQGDTEGARNAWEEGLAVAVDVDSPQLAKELRVALENLA